MALTKYYNTGGGELFFTPYENGVYGIETSFGQTEDIKFSTSIETLTHDNTESSTTYEDMSLLKKVTGSIAIDTIEISPNMLTRAFLGTSTVLSIAAATAATATVTVVTLGIPVLIGKKNLSNVSVTDSGAVTTYVESTDYVINYLDGTITIPTTGSAILAADSIIVTFDNAKYNDIKIESFLNSKIEGLVRFVSSPANGLRYIYTFHKVSLLASGDFALKSSSEFSKLSFEGKMLASDLITDPNVSKLFKIEATELV